MRKFIAFACVVSLSACSGGSGTSLGNLNPLNWFKGGPSQALAERGLAPREGYTQAVETRPLAAQVLQVVVDRTPAGIILRATALNPSEGWHSADLVLAGVSSGVLTYQLHARPPASVTRTAPAHLRQLTVAVRLTNAQLRGIRRIQVVAAQNSRTVRR